MLSILSYICRLSAYLPRRYHPSIGHNGIQTMLEAKSDFLPSHFVRSLSHIYNIRIFFLLLDNLVPFYLLSVTSHPPFTSFSFTSRSYVFFLCLSLFLFAPQSTKSILIQNFTFNFVIASDSMNTNFPMDKVLLFTIQM